MADDLRTDEEKRVQKQHTATYDQLEQALKAGRDRSPGGEHSKTPAPVQGETT